MQSESDMCPVCIIMYPSSHSCPCRTVTSPDRFLLIHTQEDTLNSIARVTQWEHAEKTLLHLLQVKLKPREPQEASASWCCFFLNCFCFYRKDTKWETDRYQSQTRTGSWDHNLKGSFKLENTKRCVYHRFYTVSFKIIPQNTIKQQRRS